MTNVERIQKDGLMNNEPPEETLEKLFQLKDHLNDVGVAFVGVSYASKNAPNGLCGARFVRKDKLANFAHKVTRDHQGFIHIELTEYVDITWPDKFIKPCLI